ncbi:phage integrase [Bartonella australis AUST/NH1]|uniref:Phage integrase n=1 Tax=Bartonella australis (strain Aust/NH1) TaxID=1094489 RepID=M1NZK5_BARAA|nr:tyrosine-type recombinase/integrase [Bartonella australis]AGF74857.1 phage integrase [Bartonella australis AUST/NH1]
MASKKAVQILNLDATVKRREEEPKKSLIKGLVRKGYESLKSKLSKPRHPKKGSIEELICKYYESIEWNKLSEPTRRQRQSVFTRLINKSGHVPYSAITKKTLQHTVNAQQDKPGAAGNFMKAMSGLFKWAVDMDYIITNPAIGVKRAIYQNKDGFIAWTEKDVETYYAHWPERTKERVWLDVLLYTGLRRGDAVRIGWKDVRDGILFLTTEKSGFQTEVHLPLLPALQDSLERGKTGSDNFICGEKGDSLTKESFGNYFRKACNEAGIKKSAHGVRKIAATRAANSGATLAQMKALFGWTDDTMASHYTKTADRRRLAIEAINKLNKSSE